MLLNYYRIKNVNSMVINVNLQWLNGNSLIFTKKIISCCCFVPGMVCQSNIVYTCSEQFSSNHIINLKSFHHFGIQV